MKMHTLRLSTFRANYFATTIFFLGLCGCAGSIPTPDREYSEAPFVGESVKKKIHANQAWQSTRVFLKVDDTVYIDAAGEWNACNNALLCGSVWVSSAEGRYGGASHMYSQWPLSALIGKIGAGQPFLIGAQEVLKVTDEGELLLRMNEADWGINDNAGSVTVEINKKSKHKIVQSKSSKSSLEPEDANTVSNDIGNTSSASWAVVIGISQYKHSSQDGLSNLIFADDDAKAFTRSLRNIGWSESHIKLLTNEKATQRNIMIALESWLSKSGPSDQIILFWAGHGYPDPEDPEKVYFACYDTDISIPSTGYRMDNVRRSLEEKKARNVILFADTCHAGKLITRGDGSRGLSIVPNIKNQNVPKGWIFMVGADTDRQAIEHSSWRNGAFTHSLIKGLNGRADGFQSAGAKDGIVTLGELRAYMNTAMPDETQKVLGVAKRPVITTSTGDPNIWNLTLQPAE